MATKYADNRSFVKNIEMLNAHLQNLARVMNEVNAELKNIKDSNKPIKFNQAA